MITYLQLDENIKGANINGRVYIHRYSVAYMMGWYIQILEIILI